MSPVVEAVELTKVYGQRRGEDIHALRGLNLTVGHQGAVHGFLGPNGSGKTTAIRCLLGLIRPTSGRVRIFGIDSATRFDEVAHRVGAIVESPKMFPHFTGRKNLSLLAGMYGLASSEVDRVLEIVRLDGRDGDTFESYSLGMRQRLAIAGALLKSPDLLILDEPANGLDPAGIAEMRTLIRTVADQGATILVSSHQLSEVEQVCTEATIIFDGAVVESGSLADIRSKHGATTVVVRVDQPDRAVRILEAAGLPASRRVTPELAAAVSPDVPAEVVVEVDAAESPRVTKALADDGLYLSELRLEATSLEEAFFELTAPPAPGPGDLMVPSRSTAGGPPPRVIRPESVPGLTSGGPT